RRRRVRGDLEHRRLPGRGDGAGRRLRRCPAAHREHGSGNDERHEESTMLEMRNVSKVYRTDTVETHALREFSLSVQEGEFVSVTGPSGSGKTTFLNIAGLLEECSGGTYELDGRDVSRLSDRERSKVRNEKIGFIFQSLNLIPDLDI